MTTDIAFPGSDNYYALLKTTPEKQYAIKTILVLFETFLTIPFTLKEDEIVRLKLRWWKEEIIKTQHNAASHPLSKELFLVMRTYQLNYNALLQSLSSIEAIVQNGQFASEQSLRDFYTYTYGVRERMIAKILIAEIASNHIEAIHHFAYALALIDNLRHLRQRIKKMYVFFSDEEARELNIDKHLILTMKASDPLKPLFQRQIDKAREHFQLGLNLLNTNESPLLRSLKPILLRVSLGLSWCELIRQENFPLFTHQIELTPIRKWWHSWRYS